MADDGNHPIRVLKPGSVEEPGDAAVERLLMRMRDAYARVDHARLETRERRLTPSGWSTREGMDRGDSRLRARFSIRDYGEVEAEWVRRQQAWVSGSWSEDRRSVATERG